MSFAAGASFYRKTSLRFKSCAAILADRRLDFVDASPKARKRKFAEVALTTEPWKYALKEPVTSYSEKVFSFSPSIPKGRIIKSFYAANMSA
jgi:hypothetical protein